MATTFSAVSPKQPEVESWLRESGYPARRIESLAGDVSTRRYLRVELAAGGTAVLAFYPPAIRRVCLRFATTTRWLRHGGVRVPEILARDCRRGLMLLEDVGRSTLYERRRSSWRRLEPAFVEALAIAARVARLPADRVSALNPELGREVLGRELEQTWEMFLEPAGLSGTGRRRTALRAALESLCDELAGEPSVPCHRDFMARNLVPLAGGGLAVLDHQDLRLGPPHYDVASLLNDSLFPPPSWERRWLGEIADRPERYLSYRRATAQRALKAIGTFTAFARRGERRHLPLVRPTLERARRHLLELPETRSALVALNSLWDGILARGAVADLLD